MSVAEIKARPTVYRGIQMRSRLEARVAAWLDAGNIDWQYEPMAFADRSGQYLPDFLINRNGRRIYMEVRPTIERARAALTQMARVLTSDPVAILCIVVPDESIAIDASLAEPWAQTTIEFGP